MQNCLGQISSGFRVAKIIKIDFFERASLFKKYVIGWRLSVQLSSVAVVSTGLNTDNE